jgi:hypothetical protein
MISLEENIVGFLVTLKTHSRYPEPQRDNAYTYSYRTIRLVLGFLGILLPFIFIIGEASFLKGGVQVRGSLSAYYHSPMQDIFVGGLVVIGFLLATYMSGELKSWDFWASLIAGIAVLGVVFFPTARPGHPTPACGSNPQPSGCSFVEQILGEHQTEVIHAICAITFILGLAVMSFLFAISEVQAHGQRPTEKPGLFRKQYLFWAHSACTLIILAAGAWAFWGIQIGQLTPLYIGEVGAVWAFGASWLVTAFKLTAPARPGPPPPPPPTSVLPPHPTKGAVVPN